MIKLINDDCLSALRNVEDNSIDLIITDPPYGVEFSKGFDDSLNNVKLNIKVWVSEMWRVLKNNCHCYVFIPTKQAGLWLSTLERYFTINNILSTRTYTGSVFNSNNFKFDSQLVVYCSKGKAKNFNEYNYFKTSEAWFNDKRNKNPKEYTYRYPSFISEVFSNVKVNKTTMNKRHPCEKNPDFIDILVNISSNEGDTVLDMFMGGGSVGVSSIRNKRKFIGVELNEDYYNLAKERLLC